MIDPQAEMIIRVTLAARERAQDLPALRLLDAVMIQYWGAKVSFGAKDQPWKDWLDPPSPFAIVLREAFAPTLPDSNLEFWNDPRPDIAVAARDLWKLSVVEPFTFRYGLQLI